MRCGTAKPLVSEPRSFSRSRWNCSVYACLIAAISALVRVQMICAVSSGTGPPPPNLNQCALVRAGPCVPWARVVIVSD